MPSQRRTKLLERSGVEDVLRLEPRPTTHDRSPTQHSQSAPGVGLARDDERHGALPRGPGGKVAWGETVHLAVDFECYTRARSGGDDGLDSERVRIAVEDQP